MRRSGKREGEGKNLALSPVLGLLFSFSLLSSGKAMMRALACALSPFCVAGFLCASVFATSV